MAAQPTPAPLPTTSQQPSAQTQSIEVMVEQLRRLLPQRTDDLTSARIDEIQAAARRVDQKATALVEIQQTISTERLRLIHRLVLAKQNVDEEFHNLLDRRFDLLPAPNSNQQQEQIQGQLRTVATLFDLSGRLNWALRRIILESAIAFSSRSDLRAQLVDQLSKDKSTIGASIMAALLLDPPPGNRNNATAASPALKRKVLELLGARGRAEVLTFVVDYLRSGQATPELSVLATDTIIRMGLPQKKLPGDTPDRSNTSDAPGRRRPEPMTATDLRTRLASVSESRLRPGFRQHRTTLSGWLEYRATKGVSSKGYYTNGFGFLPGDWLLMRNASPYNLFTNLSPGLFTHVGVVTLHKGSDGISRLVVVDLNERQTKIAGRNIETVLPQSLYYAVLRHEDPEVGRKMGEVAASLIGNPMEFDLSFETSRVEALRGQNLAGQKIHTYCAGLPLLCAQETGLPRDEFFPITESAASPLMVENLKKIGMSMGDELVSPTGALFGRRMRLMHFSEPMYDPSREIEQGIYDRFASGMKSQTFTAQQNFFQMLRQRLANASSTRPLLAQALARAAGVNLQSDLASAARAAAVLETLDTIAYGASDDFRSTLEALDTNSPTAQARTQEDRERIRKFREKYADLFRNIEQRRLSRGELNAELVSYFLARGQQRIDAYFFADPGGRSDGAN